MKSSFQVRMAILSKVVSDNNSQQFCKQAIIKLSLAYSFWKKKLIGQNLKHIHTIYSILELLIFF